MYRGLYGSLATVPIQAAITMATYEAVLYASDSNMMATSLGGISIPYFTAAIVSILCHPLDTIRRNWMLSALGNNTKNIKISPVRLSLKKIRTEQGFCNPFHGMTLAVVRAIAMLLLVKMKSSQVYKAIERID